MPIHKNPKVEDPELTDRVASGDIGALTSLLNKYRSEAFGFAVKVLRYHAGEAQDVVQSAEGKAVETVKRGKFKGEKSTVKSWFYTIVRNEAINYLRRRKIRSRHEGPGLDCANFGLVDPRSQLTGVERRELTDKVHAALDKLGRQQRAVASLRYLKRHSYKEISELLDITEGAVKSTLFRATERLRGLLSGTMEDYSRRPSSHSESGRIKRVY